jgi:hypothetical protein
MPPKRKAASETTASRPRKSAKIEALVSNLRQQFGDPTSVVFTPFQPEIPRSASTNLPTFFPIHHASPFDYFSLFFTTSIYQLIAKNTNTYAAAQRMQKEELHAQREWTPVVYQEVMVFIGVIIYMGLHTESETSDYWSTEATAPSHIITSFISLRRFQQIKRYLHISCSLTDINLDKNLSTNSQWWYKVEPLSSHLQPLFRSYYIPSSYVAIDELMIRCFGRTKHSYKMPNKPIKQGYKLYGIADHGYIYSWIWSSKVFGLEEILPYEGLTNTGALVQSLISTLPRTGISIYMDNYFTSIPLFQSLRQKLYGAIGTTRPHTQFPSELAKLKNDKVKLDWNTLFAKVLYPSYPSFVISQF